MNILFTIGSYNSFGGTEKITTVLANAFSSRGHHVCLAAFRGDCDSELFGLNAMINCYNLKQIALRKVLIEQKIDVIINQWCLPFFVTSTINKARKGLNIRLISVLHGVPDKSKKVIVAEDAVKASHGFLKVIAWIKLLVIHAIIKASIRSVYNKSDAYVVLSKGFIKSFQDYTGLNNTPKLLAIGNPITLPTPATHRPLYTAKKKQLLYVGRMDKENKRVNRIVEAWEQIAEHYPDWNLTLVGGGPHLEELNSYAAEKNIPRITFTGFVKEDPIRYYEESSIFMLTSDLEGFGLVLVEAMAYGVVPIVYGSYVSLFDIIDNGTNGIITPTPYSQDGTIAAMRKLMDNPELLATMSAAAIEKSMQFNLESIVKQWEELLK